MHSYTLEGARVACLLAVRVAERVPREANMKVVRIKACDLTLRLYFTKSLATSPILDEVTLVFQKGLLGGIVDGVSVLVGHIRRTTKALDATRQKALKLFPSTFEESLFQLNGFNKCVIRGARHE